MKTCVVCKKNNKDNFADGDIGTYGKDGFDVCIECYESGDLLTWLKNRKDIILAFIQQVEKQAEENMLKTGKLEGAHYAAMKKLAGEL